MSDEHAALRLADAAARALAQSEFTAPLVLEAGAGTGKTATLVARVVAWCLGPGWERSQTLLAQEARPGRGATPERVAARVLGRTVAITFTEAAAAEMATRVDAALREIEQAGLPVGVEPDLLPDQDRSVPRARALRGALDHLVVQTIHAWCRRLLAAHPLEAGLHPSLEVDADGRQQAAALREVIERRLQAAYAPAPAGDERWIALAERGIAPHELEQGLGVLRGAGLPARVLSADPIGPGAVERTSSRLRSVLTIFREAGGDRMHHAAPRSRDIADAVAAILPLLEPLPTTRGELEPLVEVIQARLGEKECQRLRTWARGTFNKSETTALDGREEAFAPVAAQLAGIAKHLGALDLDGLALARPVAGELLDELEAELRRRGVLTFDALLAEASGLLSERPDVASLVRRDIDQLLVDEFQDTDRRQCAIVGAVALDGPAEERPGLFIVGDPKQSIYGWRSADLAAYEGFVARACAAGGTKHVLAVNHRSAPAILDEVQRVIAPVMVREEAVQPEFQRLVPSPAKKDDGGFAAGRFAPVEYWVSALWDPEAGAARRTGAAEATALEARALARDLRRLRVEHGVSFSDVGLLFRSRGDWDVYLGALREAGVPFAVEGDRSYFRRREIIDAAAWVRCVLDPGDVLALLAVLRSAPVGVPDAALVPLWARELPGLVARLPSERAAEEIRVRVEEVGASLPVDVPGLERVSGWSTSLLAALEAIAALRHDFDEEPADVFVERLRVAVLLEATEAARYLGAWRVANLDRFFRDLSADLSEGIPAGDVLRRLRHAVAEEEPTEEGQPRDLAPDAVNVLTLHGAKGLDFEHVYLMQLHKGPAPQTPDSAFAETRDGEPEYRLFGWPTLGWDRIDAERERTAAAERVRTLYVGMTRARRRLVVAGVWPELQTQSRDAQHVALLTQRDPAPPEPLAARMAELAASGLDRIDAAGARWVFPALDTDLSSAALTFEAAPLPVVETVRAESASLRTAAIAAERRMTRPLGRAASAEARSDDEEAHPYRGGTDALDGDQARWVGTAIHRVLETWDLAAETESEIARQREGLVDVLRPLVPPPRLAPCVTAAAELLEAIGRGSLLARLQAARGDVVARELPLLAAPEGEAGAIWFVVGTIDLLLREGTGYVVVDYKTDRLADDAALEARADAYAAQGEVYARAVREAFDLAESPRFELWFLAHDRCVVAPGRAVSAAPRQLSLTLD